MNASGLLFFPPRGWLGRIIDTFTHHAPGVPNVAHVAVVLQERGDHYLCVESWAPMGVRWIRYPKGAGILMPIPMDEDGLQRDATALVGKGYDWAAYPWLAVDGALSFFGRHIRRNPFENDQRWVCSELAAYLIRIHALDRKWEDIIDRHVACWSPQRLANAVWKEI